MRDPNLVKIKDANLEDIQRNNLTLTLAHADNYLFYMTNGNQNQIKKEMQQFLKYLQGFVQ